MAAVLFDPVAFRAQFTVFADPTLYPDITLQMYFNVASLYINPNQRSWCWIGLNTLQLTQALYLMTAHLLALNNLIIAGEVAGVLVNATVDKVTITYEAPPADSMWKYWLASTPYGMQLYALLVNAGAGGFYFGGRRELSAFRRV